MKKILIFSLILPVVLSCNVYSPLAQKSSTEDLVEEGRKCLHDGDFSCAIEAYSQIPDVETKNRQMCQVYLAKSGMTLKVLINTLTAGTSTILGGVAKAMMPWSQEKQDAADLAKTYCNDFKASASSGNPYHQSVLLQTIALFGRCAIRMARTDVYVASSNADTTCTTAGNSSGVLTNTDISDNSNGSIGSSGMCVTHVTECNTDIAAVDSTGLGNAGLNDIKAGYLAIPAALRTAGTAAVTVRAALRLTVD